MSRLLREKLNIEKTTRFAVILNAVQILAMSGVFFYVLFNTGVLLSRNAELLLLGFCLVIVIWGAAMDIHEAITARKVAEQTLMIEEAYRQLEDLNATLRRQRHDFMNHLQVVFSLTEMEEHGEAMQYIERVYDDIQRVGSVLKTSIPAVNALIAAKHADCEERDIEFSTEITSPWANLPVSGWEMCRILGNLIDNARDAAGEIAPGQRRYIRVALSETPNAFTFQVANNGPAIPEKHISSIFQMGFTTKSDGHGSGLSIVSEIMESYGGSISVRSDAAQTCFSGVIPKTPPIPRSGSEDA